MHVRQVHPLNHTHWAPSTNGKESPVPMHKQGGAQRPLHHRHLHPPWRGSEDVCVCGEGGELTSWAPWTETHALRNDSSKRRATRIPCVPQSVPSTPCPSREGTQCQGSQAQPRLKWLLSTGTQSASQTRPSDSQTQVFCPKDAVMGRRAGLPSPRRQSVACLPAEECRCLHQGPPIRQGAYRVLRGSHQPSALRSDTPGPESPSSEQAQPLGLSCLPL